MRNKIIFTLTLLLTINIVLLIVVKNAYKTEKATKERYFTNMQALTDSVYTYQTKTGNMVTVSKALELSLSEAQKLNLSLLNEVNKLKLKTKNLQSVLNTEIITHYISLDTIVFVETKTDTLSNKNLRIFSYSDEWINCQVKIRNCETIEPGGLTFQSRNNIVIATEKVYKRFLFWKRPKALHVHVTNTNPYSKSTQTQYINLKK